MDILIIAVLIIAAVILFLVELFVIPGISLSGISALVCILYANYYAFANLGMAGGFITLGISAIACIALIFSNFSANNFSKVFITQLYLINIVQKYRNTSR